MNNSKTSILAPGSIIGILGGGQLGRMLALAAARLGFITYIYNPSANCPAAQVAAKIIVGAYDDIAAIQKFAQSVDVMTYEFENVPSATAEAAVALCPVFPPKIALETAQDRMTEKDFIANKAGVPVAPNHTVDNEFDAKRALNILGDKIVIKTRRMGYDGKGQQIVETDDAAMAAFKDLGSVPCIAEKFIPFAREVSVVAARNSVGDIAAYPLIENEHRNHILHKSTCPTHSDDGQAQAYTIKILQALDYVGVMAVEFFQLADGSIIVNEIAPRVHNSGHWTMDAGCTDQFELHIRAITGWPLGSTQPLYRTEMINLLGDDVQDWLSLAKDPNVKIHFYGKSDIRKGRKMGHINRRVS